MKLALKANDCFTFVTLISCFKITANDLILFGDNNIFWVFCMAQPCEGPALAVDSDLKLKTTCMHMVSSKLLTSGYPIRNQAIPLFGFLSN